MISRFDIPQVLPHRLLYPSSHEVFLNLHGKLLSESHVSECNFGDCFLSVYDTHPLFDHFLQHNLIFKSLDNL